MPTYVRRLTFQREYTSNGTGACFSGSDSASDHDVTLGGSITSDQDVYMWRRKIRLGRQATGTYAGNLIELAYTPGYCEARRWCLVAGKWATIVDLGELNTLSGNLDVPDGPSGSIDSTANAQALSYFVSNCRSAQGSFRGSTFVAELGDTLRGLRNPAAGIRGLLDTYSKRNQRNIRKAIGRDPAGTRVSDLNNRQRGAANRALAESWLELQFGVLPLASDAIDAYKSYLMLSRREPRVPVSGRSERGDSLVITSKTRQFGNFFYRNEIHTQTIYGVNYYGAVKVKVDTFTSRAIEESGFRFRDFVPALWEWIPYSFLVDYFTNVGDIVEAACFPRSDVAWVGRSWRNVVTRDFSRGTMTTNVGTSYPVSGSIVVDKFSPMRGLWRRKVFSRAEYNGPLVPRLLLEIPGFRNFKRYLNIGALAALRGMRR